MLEASLDGRPYKFVIAYTRQAAPDLEAHIELLNLELLKQGLDPRYSNLIPFPIMKSEDILIHNLVL